MKFQLGSKLDFNPAEKDEGALKRVLDLEFHLFRTDMPSDRHLPLRDSAYLLWKNSWSETFKELGVDRVLAADDFLHKELGGLFHEGKAVGFMLYHFLDMSHLVFRETAYFGNYPADVKAMHDARPEPIMVITYMTLSPEWRKSVTDIPISELLMGFSVLRFLTSEATRVIGYFRNNRKTNEMFYRHGGQPLKLASSAYNVDVDFAEITKESARLSTDVDSAHASRELWNRFMKGKTDGRDSAKIHGDSRKPIADFAGENNRRADGSLDRKVRILRLER